MSDVSERDQVTYFCSSIADQNHVRSGKSRFLRLFSLIHNLQIFILWEEHIMENLNTGQAVLKSLNALGFRGVVQGMLKYRDPQSN